MPGLRLKSEVIMKTYPRTILGWACAHRVLKGSNPYVFHSILFYCIKLIIFFKTIQRQLGLDI